MTTITNDTVQNGITSISELVNVGALMANVMFNLSQNTDIPVEHRDTMYRLYREWDAAMAKTKKIS